tara:strand:+ start:801 stop:1052 length:252 start_codon:yes stop_codon:yes gene_type:complete
MQLNLLVLCSDEMVDNVRTGRIPTVVTEPFTTSVTSNNTGRIVYSAVLAGMLRKIFCLLFPKIVQLQERLFKRQFITYTIIRL